jgi:hypothetical protein
VEVDVVSLCPEFPNDNPALHRGVSWVCLDVTHGAVAVREASEAESAQAVPALEASVLEASVLEDSVGLDVASEIAAVAAALALAIEPVPPSVSVAELLAPFEIERDEIERDELLAPFEIERDEIERDEIERDEMPAARISGVVPVGQDLHLDDAEDEFLVEELPPLEETVCVEGAVAAASLADQVHEAEREGERVAPVATTLPGPPDDAFSVLVMTLGDVALSIGSPHVASVLPGLLLEGRLDRALPDGAAQALAEGGVAQGAEVSCAFVAQTHAWRAILAGTSDDFSACGNAMLDEWCAELLARLLGAPSRAAELRRDLRERGVAAFGLVEAA